MREVLLDLAEQGYSLGIILLGAQQTASRVEEPVLGNVSLRVVGYLETAEASKEHYAYLSDYSAAAPPSYSTAPSSSLNRKSPSHTRHLPLPCRGDPRSEIDSGPRTY